MQVWSYIQPVFKVFEYHSIEYYSEYSAICLSLTTNHLLIPLYTLQSSLSSWSFIPNLLCMSILTILRMQSIMPTCYRYLKVALILYYMTSIRLLTYMVQHFYICSQSVNTQPSLPFAWLVFCTQSTMPLPRLLCIMLMWLPSYVVAQFAMLTYVGTYVYKYTQSVLHA